MFSALFSKRAAATNKPAAVEPVNGARYVARQPILDVRGRVHAYELLYRKGTEVAFHGNCELAARTVLDNTVIFGLDAYTGGALAFVNCTAGTLTEDLVSVLPSDTAVLELLETVKPTAEVLDVCAKLKAQGFKLALDDFVWSPEMAPLVDLADYIKVDFLASDAEARKDLFRELKGKRAVLVAEKVETRQEYQVAKQEGFTLFQGFYFCHPELVKNRKVPANHLCHLEILRQLHSEPVDFDALADQVRRDESLTYRLLRLINSVGMAVREEVTSVHEAMVLLGENTFRRIATLAIATELNSSQPPEILKMAMVRGRFCELAAEPCGFIANEQYLLGMLGLLPAMLGVPMEELAPGLPLRKEIREALEGKANREGSLLQWLKLHERGNWIACEEIVEQIGVKQEEINTCYAEAVQWTEKQFQLCD
jgi:EAL and modified HD-GYP domain-containing signal transduction protein